MIVPSMTLELDGLTLHGASRAGIATHIAVPELRLGLDIGDCPMSSVPLRTILLSHAHTDHVLGLLRLLSLRDLQGLATPKVLAPAESVPAMRRWLAAWDELEARSRAPTSRRLTTSTPSPGRSARRGGGCGARGTR